MSVTCVEMVSALETFAKVASCEAEYRGICNRSYYSVYHDAKQFWQELADAGYVGQVDAAQRGGMHMDLCTRLMRPDVPKGDPRRSQSRQIGAIMMDMLLKRTKADYKPTENIDEVDARSGVTGANNVLKLLAGGSIGTPLPLFSGPRSETSNADSNIPILRSAAVASPRSHLKTIK